MPRTSLDRMSPEMTRQRFVKDLRKTIDSHRVANTPTYEEIGDQIGISRRTMCSRMRNGDFSFEEFAGNGDFSFEEFAGIARILRFTEQEICKLVTERSVL